MTTYYKGYKIEPKQDFGSYGFFIRGKEVRKGWIVTQRNVNVMPGAIWFETIKSAKNSIDILEKYGEKRFWIGVKKERR